MWETLPPVALIPMANLHLDLQISPRIFEKIQQDPNVIFRGLGEDDSWKKDWSKKSRDTLPLKLFTAAATIVNLKLREGIPTKNFIFPNSEQKKIVHLFI